MDKSEFERIKAEEKAHLRKLRALKGQHRDAKRKASILGAMQNMTSSAEQSATYDEMTGGMMRKAAETEARFEMAAEEAERTAKAEADAELVRQSEAEALIRQMKAELGAGAPSASTPAPTAAPSGAKTIGRTPPPEEPPASDPTRGAKSIGRPKR